MEDSPPTPRRPWLRFSLRFLMLLVALIAIPLAWKMNRVHNQRAVVAEVMRLNGQISYYHQRRRVKVARRTAEPPGPKWLRGILGDEFFADVDSVSVDGEQVNDHTIRQIASLPHLKRLGIRSNSISDAGLKNLAGHSELESLSLNSSSLTDTGLRHLCGMTKLESLSLARTQCTTEGVSKLQKALPICKIQWYP